MTIYYVDPIGGNNANAGTSFALRKKDVTSVTTAAGDEVRLIASAAPVNTGNTALWDSQRVFTSVNITSSTNANPISITTSTPHGFVDGDIVFITGHATNTNANGTWQITLTGASTFTINATGNGIGSGGTVQDRTGQTIYVAGTAFANNLGFANSSGASTGWLGVTNSVFSAVQGASKEGAYYLQLAVNATFTTGKIGYCTLPGGAKNLSGFQQVCLWVQQSAGTLATAGQLQFRLCSDTLGDTVVNTINIPAFQATGVWYPVVVDLATNLGTSIASISFALASDSGAQTFRFCNPFVALAASNPACLTLNSMVGKGGTNTYYHIQSINTRLVVLDSGTTMNLVQRFPVKTAETVALWKREPLSLSTGSLGSAQATTSFAGGTAAVPIVLSGGWNRTDMSTQTGESVYDFQFRNITNGFSFSTTTINASNISIGRATGVAVNVQTTGVFDFNQITATNGTSCISVPLGANPGLTTVADIDYNTTTRAIEILNTAANFTGSYGVDYIGSGQHTEGIFSSQPGCIFETIGVIENNSGTAIRTAAGNMRFKSITSIQNNGGPAFNQSASSDYTRIDSGGTWSNNSGYALLPFGEVYVNALTTTGHTGTVAFTDNRKVYAKDCTFNEVTKISVSANSVNCTLYSQDEGNLGIDYIYSDGGTIQSDVTTRHTASGKSWAFKPTSTSLRTVTYPLRLTIAKVAVSANSLVTVKAWVRRTNTALNLKIVCAAGQIAGVTTDAEASISAIADTWEEVTITFTPTEAGVVAIEALAWGGTTHTGYVDDLTITQA